jgi:predicted TIM-barrel fold metal-dependent hydrolase
VFSGVFDRHPNLKIITHHLGGIVPYLEGRVGYGWDQLGARTSKVDYSALRQSMKKRPVDYFRMFPCGHGDVRRARGNALRTRVLRHGSGRLCE